MVGEGDFRSHIGHDGRNVLRTFSGFTFEGKANNSTWEKMGDVGGVLTSEEETRAKARREEEEVEAVQAVREAQEGRVAAAVEAMDAIAIAVANSFLRFSCAK